MRLIGSFVYGADCVISAHSIRVVRRYSCLILSGEADGEIGAFTVGAESVRQALVLGRRGADSEVDAIPGVYWAVLVLSTWFGSDGDDAPLVLQSRKSTHHPWHRVDRR